MKKKYPFIFMLGFLMLFAGWHSGTSAHVYRFPLLPDGVVRSGGGGVIISFYMQSGKPYGGPEVNNTILTPDLIACVSSWRN